MTVCPAVEVPTVTQPPRGGWVTPKAGTEAVHPQVPQGYGSLVFFRLAQSAFQPAAPSNKRGPSALLSQSSAVPSVSASNEGFI